MKANNGSKLRKFFKNNYAGYICISPLILGILIFYLYPVICTIIYSFTNFDIFTNTYGAATFQHYKDIFFTNKDITFKSLGITFKYTLLMVPINMVVGFLLALLLRKENKFNRVFRLLFYLPCLIPVMVAGIVWVYVSDVRGGIGNAILTALGLPEYEFLNSAQTSFPTIVIFSLFGCSSSILIWLSALKAIPKSLYEAAELDGANKFKQMLSITLPGVSPFILYNLLTNLIATLQIFGNIFTITGGTAGREDSLLFFSIYIYREAFTNFNVSYASALSMVLFVIIAIICFIMLKTSRWVYYGDESSR